MAKQWAIALFITLLAGAAIFGFQTVYHQVEPETRREKQPRVVNVISPVSASVSDRVTAVGTLRSRQQIELTSEVSGRIVELNFEPGQQVEKGQLLVRLSDRQAKADLQVADATLEDARRQYQRASRLRSNNSISQSQLDALRTQLEVAEAQQVAASTRLADHRIEAPFAGTVGLRDLSVGAYLNIGDSVATLDATGPMELNFSVPERFLGAVSQGQALSATTAAFPDETFRGTLAELGSRLDELSRTLPVKALIDNPDGRLKPGLFMSVSLILRERDSLVIPEQAVLVQGRHAYVFVVEGNKATRTRVVLGSREPGQVEVASGLSTGHQVVVTGQDRLSSGDLVTIQVDEDALVVDKHAVRPARQGGVTASGSAL
ncbi:MAG: efflux transporter periplasmic adaptor subunit [unclassified Hahellaceae]|nr:efflux transporter periplasmic adaptor subunit [Hahellaceae bacterium]|tara:strand:- start:71148 stop:72275 length:1128 start_codon:yes stop_codon:yes gene_type:complete